MKGLFFFFTLLLLVSPFFFPEPFPDRAEAREVLAEVDGEAISTERVEMALVVPLTRLEQEIYELKRQKLEELIAEILLQKEAAERGLSVEELLEVEVAAKVRPVTEGEIEAFYREHQARLSGEERIVRAQIRRFLETRRLKEVEEVFLRRLRSKHRVVIYLKLPPPRRVTIPDREGAHVKGPSEAPVTIVEFSDFQCPFCRRALPVLKRVLTTYPEVVKLIYRHFPLDQLHPQARRAAEAAECAGAQGHFWAYHDRLFAQTDLSPSKLVKLARELKLDLPAFKRCLDKGWAWARVAEDIETATRLGVTGTPTFFVNGRPLVGAQPFEAFKALIEEELAARRRTPGSPSKPW